MNHPLIKPIITEKSMRAAARGVYTFSVTSASTKPAIKAAVERLFPVHVLRIRTHILKSALRRTGRRRLPVSASSSKLARVWLKKGDSIALFDIKKD